MEMNVYYQEPDHMIYCGHALDILGEMPDESVDMAMTSPPYWGLRTYKTEPIIWGDNCEHEWGKDILVNKGTLGQNLDTLAGTQTAGIAKAANNQGNFCLKCGAWKGELGLEPTIELYIEHLILIFNEVKRVLKKTGTCWVNLDDSYAGSGKASGQSIDQVTPKQATNFASAHINIDSGMPPKSLCLIPQRFAIAMVQNGWLLRNDIVWNKPNPMPESVKDRFTGSWEHLFFFVKNNKPTYWVNPKTHRLTDKQPLGTQGIEGEDWEWIEHAACQGKGCSNKRCVNGKIKSSLWEGRDYWFEQQFEQQQLCSLQRLQRSHAGYDPGYPGGVHSHMKEYFSKFNKSYSVDEIESIVGGRNKRDVWEITTEPYPEAHFATFPEKLCEIPVLAGCPSMICKKCGRAREPIYKREPMKINRSSRAEESGIRILTSGTMVEPNKCELEGYTDCVCNAGFEPGMVLDPFTGSGTAQAVAKKLGRKSIGIELNPDYCKLAARRLQEIPLAMPLLVGYSV